MKQLAKHLLSAITISAFFFMGLASTPSEKSMAMDASQLPPDIKGYDGTLLIYHESGDWTKYAERHFSENYTGKFAVAERKEIETTYADTDKYRFLLSRDQSISTTGGPARFSDGSVNQAYATSAAQNLVLLDRKTGKVYLSRSTGYYGKLLRAFAISLETARKG